MKSAISALLTSAEVCIGIFCLIIYGRFSPIADSVLAQMKIPLNSVPPIMPVVIGLLGCILIVSLAFKLSLPSGG